MLTTTTHLWSRDHIGTWKKRPPNLLSTSFLPDKSLYLVVHYRSSSDHVIPFPCKFPDLSPNTPCRDGASHETTSKHNYKLESHYFASYKTVLTSFPSDKLNTSVLHCRSSTPTPVCSFSLPRLSESFCRSGCLDSRNGTSKHGQDGDTRKQHKPNADNQITTPSHPPQLRRPHTEVARLIIPYLGVNLCILLIVITRHAVCRLLITYKLKYFQICIFIMTYLHQRHHTNQSAGPVPTSAPRRESNLQHHDSDALHYYVITLVYYVKFLLVSSSSCTPASETRKTLGGRKKLLLVWSLSTVPPPSPDEDTTPPRTRVLNLKSHRIYSNDLSLLTSGMCSTEQLVHYISTSTIHNPEYIRSIPRGFESGVSQNAPNYETVYSSDASRDLSAEGVLFCPNVPAEHLTYIECTVYGYLPNSLDQAKLELGLEARGERGRTLTTSRDAGLTSLAKKRCHDNAYSPTISSKRKRIPTTLRYRQADSVFYLPISGDLFLDCSSHLLVDSLLFVCVPSGLLLVNYPYDQVSAAASQDGLFRASKDLSDSEGSGSTGESSNSSSSNNSSSAAAASNSEREQIQSRGALSNGSRSITTGSNGNGDGNDEEDENNKRSRLLHECESSVTTDQEDKEEDSDHTSGGDGSNEGKSSSHSSSADDNKTRRNQVKSRGALFNGSRNSSLSSSYREDDNEEKNNRNGPRLLHQCNDIALKEPEIKNFSPQNAVLDRMSLTLKEHNNTSQHQNVQAITANSTQIDHSQLANPMFDMSVLHGISKISYSFWESAKNVSLFGRGRNVSEVSDISISSELCDLSDIAELSLNITIQNTTVLEDSVHENKKQKSKDEPEQKMVVLKRNTQMKEIISTLDSPTQR